MTERTIIGIDPHKQSWTAVATDARGSRLAALRVPVSAAGYRTLRRFARKYSEPLWVAAATGDCPEVAR